MEYVLRSKAHGQYLVADYPAEWSRDKDDAAIFELPLSVLERIAERYDATVEALYSNE